MVVGVGGGRRGMVGAVPGASAAPHLVPSNNKLRLASNGELDLADVNLADMDPEVIRVSSNPLSFLLPFNAKYRFITLTAIFCMHVERTEASVHGDRDLQDQGNASG